jgi:hypothetical protein
LDGEKITEKLAGIDVNPDGSVSINTPTLYNLVSSEESSPHIIEIQAKSGFEIYTFTFG